MVVIIVRIKNIVRKLQNCMKSHDKIVDRFQWGALCLEGCQQLPQSQVIHWIISSNAIMMMIMSTCFNTKAKSRVEFLLNVANGMQQSLKVKIREEESQSFFGFSVPVRQAMWVELLVIQVIFVIVTFFTKKHCQRHNGSLQLQNSRKENSS